MHAGVVAGAGGGVVVRLGRGSAATPLKSTDIRHKVSREGFFLAN